MYVDEVNGTACAVPHEPFQVCQTGRRASKGDGWATELGLACERLHVRSMACHGLIYSHTGRSSNAQIWLIEREESVRSIIDGGLCCCWPDICQTWSVVEKHRYEGQGRVEIAINTIIACVGIGGIVVRPVDLRVLTGLGPRVGQSAVCVHQPSFTAVLDECCSRRRAWLTGGCGDRAG